MEDLNRDPKIDSLSFNWLSYANVKNIVQMKIINTK